MSVAFQATTLDIQNVSCTDQGGEMRLDLTSVSCKCEEQKDKTFCQTLGAICSIHFTHEA